MLPLEDVSWEAYRKRGLDFLREHNVLPFRWALLELHVCGRSWTLELYGVNLAIFIA